MTITTELNLYYQYLSTYQQISFLEMVSKAKFL